MTTTKHMTVIRFRHIPPSEMMTPLYHLPMQKTRHEFTGYVSMREVRKYLGEWLSIPDDELRDVDYEVL